MVVVLAVPLYCWGADIAVLFADDADALDVCRQAFHILAPWYATFVFTEVMAGAIRGVGQTVAPMVITLLGTCVLRIIWMLAVVPHHWEFAWAAATYPITWVVTSAAFVAYWFVGSWRKKIYAPDDAV